MKFDIITIFPEQLENFIKFGVLRIAQEKGNEINIHNLRDWTDDTHQSIDDRPYGGGAGMVLKIDPIYKALEQLKTEDSKVIALVPHGEVLKQNVLKEMVENEDQHYIILCGHYEGFDQRILDNLVDIEISVGDYILSGGELPTLLLMDGLLRLLPDVLGNKDSIIEESFENNLLEYPHYTRPETYEDWEVPRILLSGNHGIIEKWREKESLKRTKLNRPDLLKS